MRSCRRSTCGGGESASARDEIAASSIMIAMMQNLLSAAGTAVPEEEPFMCHLCDESLPEHSRERRSLLLAGASAGAMLLAAPLAHAEAPRALSFYHTHTGERLKITYAERGKHFPDALERINRFLRDFRSGETHPIDPVLLDSLHRLQQVTGGRGPYEVISAFRSPQTNEMLRSSSGGVAQRSLHMEGRAMDVRLRGVETRKLRQAALRLQVGGVGYYPSSNFVHVDTGRVRSW
jgi:uncharacterized protein YcbK (DUF882 family)